MTNWESDNRGERWLPVPDVAATSNNGGSMLTQLQSGFNTSLVLPFEYYDERHFYLWLIPTNWTICLWCSAMYLAVIYTGRRLMVKRERFELRTPLVLWNLALAMFSFCGAVRMNQELFYVIRHHGLEYSYCVSSYGQVPFGFWVVAFAVSKLFELGDTLFIVLRKQPLIFLHWYHHIATLIFTWVAYTERMSSGRWFITMNLTVHAVMYSYYAARAMRVRVMRCVNVCITSAQTLQMVIGVAVNVWVIVVKQRGQPCSQSYGNVTLALVMYFSYFLLFSWYFYNAYLKPKPAKSAKPGEAHTNGICNGITVNVLSNGVHKASANDIAVSTESIGNGVSAREAAYGMKKRN